MGTVPARQYEYRKVTAGISVGRLEVVKKTENRTINGSILWLCRCECGNEVLAQSSSLSSGLKQSCGCLEADTRKTRGSTHGKSGTREYRSWTGMKQRCMYEGHDEFANYGGRGITVDSRWADSFENFLEDMGECPEGASLDRIDVNGNYTKSNCRWEYASVQGYNSRRKSTNTSGRTGVSFHKATGKWMASIGYNGKVIYLGIHSRFEDAVVSRSEAEIKFFGKTKE